MVEVKARNEIEVFHGGVGQFDGDRLLTSLLPELIEFYLEEERTPEELAEFLLMHISYEFETILDSLDFEALQNLIRHSIREKIHNSK